MRWQRAKSLFPLLVKELTEQAARKRTYIIRVLYACILFFFFCLVFRDQLVGKTAGPLQILGSGKEMFEFLILIQFAGIFIFLPATMSGVLTYEKERDSLALLFLTDLRPWEIVLQKYAGRLIPMLSFLLLSLPLLAISYAFGGISRDYLASGVLLLFLTCLQVGAFSLMFSSFGRTTASAFVAAYVGGLLFYFFLPMGAIILDAFNKIHLGTAEARVAFAFLPPYVFADTRGSAFSTVVMRSVPIMLSIVGFLLLARLFLIRRAFVSSRRIALKAFAHLDRFYLRINRFVGGILLWKDKKPLPEDEPVAWREVRRGLLGRATYVFRILIVIEVPLLFLAFGVVIMEMGRGPDEWLSVLVFGLWCIAVLPMTVRSANAVVSERTRQTLDVLLAAPLTGEEIVRQKTRGIRRFTLLMLVPFLTLFLLHVWAYAVDYSRGQFWPEVPQLAAYMVASVLAVVIYIPMFSWVAFWVGLKARRRSRAIIAALLVIVLWNVLPIVGLILVDEFTHLDPYDPLLSYLQLLIPASMVVLTEIEELHHHFDSLWLPIIVNFLWHGFILFYFRRRCLKHADRYLGRVAASRGPGHVTKLLSALQGSLHLKQSAE